MTTFVLRVPVEEASDAQAQASRLLERLPLLRRFPLLCDVKLDVGVASSWEGPHNSLPRALLALIPKHLPTVKSIAVLPPPEGFARGAFWDLSTALAAHLPLGVCCGPVFVRLAPSRNPSLPELIAHAARGAFSSVWLDLSTVTPPGSEDAFPPQEWPAPRVLHAISLLAPCVTELSIGDQWAEGFPAVAPDFPGGNPAAAALARKQIAPPRPPVGLWAHAPFLHALRRCGTGVGGGTGAGGCGAAGGAGLSALELPGNRDCDVEGPLEGLPLSVRSRIRQFRFR